MIHKILSDARIPHLVDARVAPRPGQFTPGGIMIHHTAGGRYGDLPSLRLLQQGRKDLPGPLCQIGAGRAGTIAVVCDGRANHAGKGWSEALHRVLRDEPPQAKPGADDQDGNAWFIGIEVENAGDGTDLYPPEQANAVVAACVAICRNRGWSANRIIAHRQWTRRKTDPSRSFDELVRIRVHNELTGGSSFMPGLSESEQRDLYNRVKEVHAVTAASGYIEKTLQLLEKHVADPDTGGGAGGVSLAEFEAELRDELSKLTLSVKP